MYGLLFAIISPFFWAAMNVYDKFVVSRRVKHVAGYIPLVGLVNLLFALILAMFLDWSGVSARDLLFPALAGVLLASESFIYFKILEKEDISSTIGMAYLYPLIVALLSFVFLHEQVSLMAYAGVVLVVAGVLLLGLRLREIGWSVGMWLLVMFISLIALTEFFAKLSTGALSGYHAMAVNNIVFGSVLLLSSLHPAVRRQLREETRNIPWALIGETLTFGAVLTLYLAMADLPATIVSAIASIQPLAVLLFERLTDNFIGQISKDHLLLPKLGAIMLIAIGVALLALA